MFARSPAVPEVHRGRAGVVGIFGEGRFGAAIARRALAAGYEVRVATSGSAERTARLTSVVAPGAVATTDDDLPAGTDLLVLAVPLRRFRELPLATFSGRVVIDAMNYWPPVDGILAEFETGAAASSVVVRDALPPSAHLVKALNHLGHHQFEELARPAGSPDRIALAVSGDGAAAVDLVSTFVDALGFDPVVAGDLAASTALEPGAPVFGEALAAVDLVRRIDQGRKGVLRSTA